MKKMVESKLKDVPAEEQMKIMAMLNKNPELFMKVAKEIKEKMDKGADQMTASMEVMKTHEQELRKLVN
ncbi:MAG: hypothetical protein ABI430_00160 [Candidatus Taylorbacteria bacterium]